MHIIFNVIMLYSFFLKGERLTIEGQHDYNHRLKPPTRRLGCHQQQKQMKALSYQTDTAHKLPHLHSDDTRRF
jgi:hypothetical protein